MLSLSSKAEPWMEGKSPPLSPKGGSGSPLQTNAYAGSVLTHGSLSFPMKPGYWAEERVPRVSPETAAQFLTP